jgi:hypothetical protein
MKKYAFYTYSTNDIKMIELAEELLEDGYNVCVFKNIGNNKTSTSKVAIFDIADAFQFDGVIFTDDIRATEIALNLPLVKKIIFVVAESEWKDNIRPFEELNSYYNNDEVELWCANSQIEELLTKVWKEPKENIDGYKRQVFEQALQRLE